MIYTLPLIQFLEDRSTHPISLVPEAQVFYTLLVLQRRFVEKAHCCFLS